MIRSGSKLLKKGGSVRNINKVGSKFRISLEFETVTKILANADCVITWERKGTVLCTEPVKVDTRSRSADFRGQKLTQIVTLFKSKKSEKSFDEKTYTISLKIGNDKGKVIGKIYLNFADYVEIPEYSKRMVAKLSHDGELIMKVTSTFTGEAKKKKSSQGSSSVSSSSRRDREREHRNRPSNVTANTSGTVAPSPSRRRERERRESDARRQSVVMPPITSLDENSYSSSGRSGGGDYGNSNNSSRRTASNNNNNTSEYSNGYGSVGGNGSRATVPRSDFEKLKRENRALVRKNNDLQAQNDELEDKLTTAGLNSNAGKVEVLEDEVDRLRKEIRDLKSRLSREPVYADVVRELKDAKMALAILSTENAELKSKKRNAL